ncbi:LysE family translocator [Pontivivens insulae]|uniref:Threonine efflux protein n=1 Tax=Pontivivens insulae TaxID=1639689 RepID=A0A2R8A8Y2_9RHOB|nr:LysE family transporter [Pontivivens insulae]RED18612.1 threonine/homoserine/homoserine lactone efflux protein [Pontivivens insulae]SPF28510.1 Threonine efflux protein [Pontivivens insulae]
MLSTVDLPLILIAALIASASPGPATLTLMGTAMGQGRAPALALASGITLGSFFWSISAAFGLGAVMLAHGWILEIVRYAGAGYLLWLAFKSAKSALTPGALMPRTAPAGRSFFLRGLALHITNPKAILFFGALYSLGIAPGTDPLVLITVILAVGVQSLIVFHGYALIFSIPPLSRIYLRARRGLEAVFALAFGGAAASILTAKLSDS